MTDDLPQKLTGIATLADRINAVALGVTPEPGSTCPYCIRPMERTALEVWLAQNCESLDTLAARISDQPAVSAFLLGRRDGRASKNLIWRLNHQAPDYVPRPGGAAAIVQVALLEITGLSVDDLRNERPTVGGYACLRSLR